MSQLKAGQMINAPDALRARAGGARIGGIDPEALAKAEAALKNLSSNFAQWLDDEIGKLDAARVEIRTHGPTTANMESLYFRGHDLKGLGTTYGFPLITRIAGSLCKLIDDKDKRLTAPLGLIDAHIQAIKAAVRDDIRSDDHPVGRVLLQELERQVRDHAGD